MESLAYFSSKFFLSFHFLDHSWFVLFLLSWSGFIFYHFPSILLGRNSSKEITTPSGWTEESSSSSNTGENIVFLFPKPEGKEPSVQISLFSRDSQGIWVHFST